MARLRVQGGADSRGSLQRISSQRVEGLRREWNSFQQVKFGVKKMEKKEKKKWEEYS